MDITTMKKILLVLTSQDTLGETGEATGYNVAEAAHPWKVFRDAGYFVDFASIGTNDLTQYTIDRSCSARRAAAGTSIMMPTLGRP